MALPFFISWNFPIVHETAETVEKVQTANSDNFGTVKNQQLTGHRKPKNAQIYGFSTASLFSLNFRELKKL
jgi:hypothetical protein